MAMIEDTTAIELEMSDADFRENYLADNRVWFANYGNQHQRSYGGVFCAWPACEEELTAETMRPNGGVNYCPRHFKERALQEMKHHFGLEHVPTPNLIQRFEWMLRVARVMDGGLVKMAETDVEPENSWD
jgi:hypothetical protein